MKKQISELLNRIDEAVKDLDEIKEILKRIDDQNTVDDVRWVQAPHKTAKEILNDRKED